MRICSIKHVIYNSLTLNKEKQKLYLHVYRGHSLAKRTTTVWKGSGRGGLWWWALPVLTISDTTGCRNTSAASPCCQIWLQAGLWKPWRTVWIIKEDSNNRPQPRLWQMLCFSPVLVFLFQTFSHHRLGQMCSSHICHQMSLQCWRPDTYTHGHHVYAYTCLSPGPNNSPQLRKFLYFACFKCWGFVKT